MTLTVETGSGGATSESYASVVDADTHLAARGHTSWASLTTGDKEAALRRATDYMQQAYRERWSGTRATATQALEWPRWNVPIQDIPGGHGSVPAYFSETAVPIEVKTACITLALKAAAGDLAPDIEPQVTSERIGSIEVSYFPGVRQTVKYQSIDNMLSPLLMNGGSGAMVRVVRS
jgi:hypothetical protein